MIVVKYKFNSFPLLLIEFQLLQLYKMLYELLSKFCFTNGNPHPQDTIYCSICRSGIETIDLSGTPSSCTSLLLSNPIGRQPQSCLLPPAALIQHDTVNHRLKNVQNSRPNAGSNTLGSRMLDLPRTTSQQFTFTIVLISELFYYTSQEDHEFELPTVITWKHIGISLVKYCTIYTYLYSRQYCYSAS
jgi:hypothetical protein